MFPEEADRIRCPLHFLQIDVHKPETLRTKHRECFGCCFAYVGMQEGEHAGDPHEGGSAENKAEGEEGEEDA